MEKNLNIVLAHEFYRCSFAYKNFIYLLVTMKKNSKIQDKINCYNFYTDFLSHFYEFYIGLIEDQIKPSVKKNDELYNPKSSNYKQKHQITDNILQLELEKLLRNRKNRLLQGYKDDLNLQVSFYDNQVPKDFGKHFRIMRNRRNHLDQRRVSFKDEITLSEFYKKYSTYMIVMYKETEWLWKVDIEDYDWKMISDFSTEISSQNLNSY